MIRDLRKYKRLFVFGCSFTSYIWPTWADILSKEMPEAEFFNFGHCGGGNMLISVRVTEANLRYTFNEDDLIIVMWTTVCREDRYRDNHWMNSGNIFTALHDYSEEFVKKYADPKGYLIRDMALITLTTSFLNSITADVVTMCASPLNGQQDTTDDSVNAVLGLYNAVIESTANSLFELEMNMEWTNGHTYTYNRVQYQDYHPDPNRYCNYLKKIGFPITDVGLEYARATTELLHLTKTKEEIEVTFYDLTESKMKVIL